MIARLRHLPQVICHSKQDDAASCAAAFRLGFFDYVVQAHDSDPLLKFILRAISFHNRRPLPAAETHSALASLTRREHQVLGYMIRGTLNKVTAIELGISEKTVKVHRARVFEKLKVTNAVSLVHLCYALGIVPDDLRSRHREVDASSN